MANLVGILQANGRDGILIPDGKGPIRLVEIPEHELNGAPFGMKVVVEILSPEQQDPARGRVLKVLGDPKLPDVAMQGIIHMHGLSEDFPWEVEAELAQVPQALSAEEIKEALSLGRKDLRRLKTFTIDGLDAKDLDDALSIEKTKNGGYRLYVHIADVAHYVKEGSAIDKEAKKRGTSAYLADRVLPMLPPQLSNGICSLNPGQDRFTLTVRLDFDKRAKFLDGDIAETIVRSDLRANYDDVYTYLEQGLIASSYDDFAHEIELLAELAQLLETQAQQRGALEFKFPETKVIMGADATVEDIVPEYNNFANDIIEQCMVAVNRFVARQFSQLKLPFLYRVHEYPDVEKLERFRELVRRQGLKVRISQRPEPKELANVLASLEGRRGQETLESLLLRSLAKAKYSHEPIGHYGLALKDYCHFTAPIRRYPDLFIHRVIKGFLQANMKTKKWQGEAKKLGEHLSECERIAIAAERDSVDQKVSEYYAKRIGEIYEAEVTGFVGAGMFVRLPSSAEGLIPFRTMNDYYHFDEVTMTVQGRSRQRLFQLGDRFLVQVAAADTIRRQVDFVLVDEEKSGSVRPDFRQASKAEQEAFSRRSGGKKNPPKKRYKNRRNRKKNRNRKRR